MLKYIGLLAILSVMMACHEPDTPVVQASTSTLRQLVETHYSPKDSITITSTFNEHGQLAQQNFSQQPSQRSYSLYCLYNPTDLTALKDINSQYRYFQSNSNQQLIATKKYFTQYGNYWAVYEADTLLYAQNRLASQVHNDFYFTSDHQGYAFKYPLWVTRRQYKYDNLNRVISEIDSVFATHDYPVGSLVIHETPPRYLYVNKATYEYNEQGEISRKVTWSGANEKPFLAYSNGSSMLYQTNPGWSTFINSWPGRFLSGTTTYTYQYRSDGLLSGKAASFEDNQTKQIYVTTFHYQY